jgi:hypothetical protein
MAKNSGTPSANKYLYDSRGRGTLFEERANILVQTGTDLYEEFISPVNRHLKWLTRDNITSGSNQKCFWRCGRCQYIWQANVKNRAKLTKPSGCPNCKKKRPDFIEERQALKLRFGYDVYAECQTPVDKCSNANKKNVSAGSSIAFWWKCHKCKHTWRAPIKARTGDQGSGCPKCAHIIRITNGLYTMAFCQNIARSIKGANPSLAEEYLGLSVKEKKRLGGRDLPAERVYARSRLVAQWSCKKCKYNWETVVAYRTRKGKPSGCPNCGQWLQRMKPLQQALISLPTTDHKQLIEKLENSMFAETTGAIRSVVEALLAETITIEQVINFDAPVHTLLQKHDPRKYGARKVRVAPSVRRAVYKRDNHTCQICDKKEGQDHVVLTLDHIIPESRGGDNRASNLRCCCATCNFVRGDRYEMSDKKVKRRSKELYTLKTSISTS